MAKKKCLICGGKIGALDRYLAIKDGCICYNCAGRRHGIFAALDADMPFKDIASMFERSTLDGIDEPARRLQELVALRKAFEPSYRVGKYALFDDGHRTMMAASNPAAARVKTYKGYTLLRYDDIVGYELLEDCETQTKGGLGRAVAGGVLFGPAGAVVGGVTGRRKSRGDCRSLQLKLTLSDGAKPAFYIPLIASETRTDSLTYRTSMEEAQNIISKLQAIEAERQGDGDRPAGGHFSGKVGNAPADPVEELRRYKALLDEGILTEEEFAAKKRQLLGI